MKVRLVSVLALFFASVPATLADLVPIEGTPPLDEPRTLQQVGLAHLQAGQLDEAENALRDYLSAEPGSIDTMMWLVEVLFRKKQINEAGAQLRRIVELRPDYALAHHALGRYHHLQQDFDASRAALEHAISLDPDLFAAHVDLGDHFMMIANDVDTAIASYERAVAIDPAHAGARYGLGVAYNRAGRYDAAESAWRRAALLAPTNPMPMYSLGNSLAAQGKIDGALAAYGAALDAEPRHIESMVARGRIHAGRSEDAEALRAFKEALAIVPDYAPAHLNMALVYHKLGNNDAAEAAYRRALEINDAQPLAHNNLAWLLATSGGDLADAARHSRLATEQLPRIGPYWVTFGWIQHLRGDDEAALASFRKAIELAPQNGSAYEYLARVHAAMGNTVAAEEAKKKAAEIQGEGS